MSARDAARVVDCDERYYLESCGGLEFFKLYGPRVPKPPQRHVLNKARLAPGMTVLDIGCGRGELLYQSRAAGASAFGTDSSEAAVRLAASVSGCPVVRCGVRALPFARASVDRVFLVGVVDHLSLQELEACFREIARVLKPGGRALVHTCCNRLYYKNWTYGLRRAAARALRAMGASVRDPLPPRTDEDRALHVHEHDLFSMRAFFRRIGWEAEVEPRPNPKLALRELYGGVLPEDFPLKPVTGWRSAAQGLLWRPPLTWVLAREFFCEAAPGRAQSPQGATPR